MEPRMVLPKMKAVTHVVRLKVLKKFPRGIHSRDTLTQAEKNPPPPSNFDICGTAEPRPSAYDDRHFTDITGSDGNPDSKVLAGIDGSRRDRATGLPLPMMIMMVGVICIPRGY